MGLDFGLVKTYGMKFDGQVCPKHYTKAVLSKMVVVLCSCVVVGCAVLSFVMVGFHSVELDRVFIIKSNPNKLLV